MWEEGGRCAAARVFACMGFRCYRFLPNLDQSYGAMARRLIGAAGHNGGQGMLT